jgi:hypothetical protein
MNILIPKQTEIHARSVWLIPGTGRPHGFTNGQCTSTDLGFGCSCSPKSCFLPDGIFISPLVPCTPDACSPPHRIIHRYLTACRSRNSPFWHSTRLGLSPIKLAGSSDRYVPIARPCRKPWNWVLYNLPRGFERYNSWVAHHFQDSHSKQFLTTTSHSLNLTPL